ncbi:MAG: pilus assembly protein PilQ [Aquificae bacterium]|nr:pilus assembly protein PilQ [Aquificota bacterium]
MIHRLFTVILLLSVFSQTFANGITAEFFGGRLSTVVDALSQITGKNIIWDRGTAKKRDTKVYLSIKQPVPAEVLFKQVLDSYGLTAVKKGSVYIIKTVKEITLSIPPDVALVLGKEPFYTLLSIVKENISPSATVRTYPYSNTVYIKDVEENINRIKNLSQDFINILKAEAKQEVKNKQIKLVQREFPITEEDFKQIKWKLVSALSPYGRYKFNKQKGILTVVDTPESITVISRILAKGQSNRIITKCYYLRATEPAELLLTISENYLSEFGSVVFKSKESLSTAGKKSKKEVSDIITSLPKVCITDTPQQIDRIKRAFPNLLLEKPYQIVIEARIVQVNSSYKKDLGIQWGGQYKGGNLFVAGSGLSTSDLSGVSYAFDFPADITDVGAGVGLLYGTANSFIDLRLSALSQIGKSKILSRPKVITIDGEKAEILQGFEIPYQSYLVAGGGQTTSIQFKKAVLRLTVLPRTTPDGNIIMDIKLSQDTPDFTKSINGQPPIQTKQVSSKVIARDGQTVVIGGVLEKTEETMESGVPILKEIPLLGWLFKGKMETTENKELLIFITPRIVYE